MRRRVVLFCLAILSLLLALPVAAQGPTPPLDKDAEAKIAPALRATLAKEGRAEFLVVLQEQADLSGASALPDRASKARFVYDRLRETAQRTQPSAIADITTQGGTIQRFTLVNALLVTGDTKLVERLARRGDVKHLEPNTAAPGVQATPDGPTQQGVGTTWGVTRVKAPQVWSQYTRGAGVVVGVADTGVAWTHPALQPKYRGWNGTTADHTYSWHDAIENSPEPVQLHSHGTHVVGTMIGEHVTDTTTNRIGVAPDARWIGCRNMAGAAGIGTPARYLDCMEFMLAPFPPTGTFIDDGQPDLGADIINNSWGCPTDEGCYPHTLSATIEALRAAGIMFVSSAGNEGPGCSTVIDPPGLTSGAFATGAFSEGGNIAGFSSRGPVTVDNSNRPKPDISAPGTNVLSSIPGGGYGSSQGTSMASPHVAGVAALVWSAVPALKGQVAVTESLLRATAIQHDNNQCGTVAGGRANNVWGWGEVDALAAVQAALASGTLSGTVTSAATGLPLANAQVNLVGPGALNLTLTTNASGQYTIPLSVGDYALTASALGYTTANAPVTLAPNGALTQNFSLVAAQEFTVSGHVRQVGNAAAIRASVEVVGAARRTTTDAAGFYSLTLPAGTYTLQAKAMAYQAVTETITVTTAATRDFSLGLAAPILIVDDDEGKDLESLYATTLTGLNRAYDTYEVRATGIGPTAELLENYCLIIWVVGGPIHRIRAADYEALKTYLNRGGRLLLSEPGGATSDFHSAYLYAERTTGSTALTLSGTGDFSGSFGYFSDGRADAAGPLTALAGGAPAFSWAGQPTYGAVAYSGAYKSLYLSFGLHNIGMSSRATFLTQALNWFGCPACQIPGDIDFNGQVNVVDIIQVAQAISATPDQPAYRYRLDRNLDAVIDTTDMQAVAAYWSASCSQ